MIVYLNGSYIAKQDAHVSVDDRGFVFGDGVYEVVRCYGGRPFEAGRHLQRMADGLAALRITGFDALSFHEIIARLLDENGFEHDDATVYMQITRGAAPRRHSFPDPDTAPTVYATAGPFVPRGNADTGATVITTPDIRWTRCDIKSLNILANCLANQQARERGALEALLIRDGVALEASACSLFGVFDGVVRTAPRSNYILPSVTRAVVLELCEELDISHEQAPIFQHELRTADELFLAGTTVEVMPIIRVDADEVGPGAPGPITGRVREAFRARTEALPSLR